MRKSRADGLGSPSHIAARSLRCDLSGTRRRHGCVAGSHAARVRAEGVNKNLPHRRLVTPHLLWDELRRETDKALVAEAQAVAGRAHEVAVVLDQLRAREAIENPRSAGRRGPAPSLLFSVKCSR